MEIAPKVQLAMDNYNNTNKFIQAETKSMEALRKALHGQGNPLPETDKDRQLIAAEKANNRKLNASVMGIMMAQQSEGQPSTTSQMPTEARGMRRQVPPQSAPMSPELRHRIEQQRYLMQMREEQMRNPQGPGAAPGTYDPEAERRMEQQQSMRHNLGY